MPTREIQVRRDSRLFTDLCNALLRRGFTKHSLEPGTQIVVEGYQAKDGANRANGRDLTFPDGRKLFIGSNPDEKTPDR